MAAPRVRKGGLFLTDNTLWSGTGGPRGGQSGHGQARDRQVHRRRRRIEPPALLLAGLVHDNHSAARIGLGGGRCCGCLNTDEVALATRSLANNADILAIAAHRDDVEQTCGGTLLKMAERGYRTAILDLTRGEMGTRGTVEERAREADDAARILKAGWRQALDIPDGRVENTYENKLKVARVIRQLRPRVLILPYWQARHPDHATAGVLGYEATFLFRTGQARPRRSAAPAVQDHLCQPLRRRASDASSSTSPSSSRRASLH